LTALVYQQQHCQIPSFHGLRCSTKNEKSFALLLSKVDRTTFAKVDPMMQKVLSLEWNSFMSITLSFYFYVLHLFLFSWCCIFVFGCAHNSVVVSLCFGGFCCLLFGCVCNNVVASLCFEDFYCLFLVVRAIMLLFCHVLHISTIVACLWVTSLTIPCATSVLACITIVVASLILLHHRYSYIAIVVTLSIFLHPNCSCIVDFFTSQIILHC